MQLARFSNRIHPLVAVAAAAVTLFSVLGIAAITGLLPSSHGTGINAPEAVVQPTHASASAHPVAHDGTVQHSTPNSAPGSDRTQTGAPKQPGRHRRGCRHRWCVG